MNRKWITEGNILIAEFMGCKIDKESYTERWYMIKDGHHGYADQLQYHCSWDWLMPVWFKFRGLKFNLPQSRSAHGYFIQNISDAILFGDITALFKEMEKAIIWYNSVLQNFPEEQQNNQ